MFTSSQSLFSNQKNQVRPMWANVFRQAFPEQTHYRDASEGGAASVQALSRNVRQRRDPGRTHCALTSRVQDGERVEKSEVRIQNLGQIPEGLIEKVFPRDEFSNHK